MSLFAIQNRRPSRLSLGDRGEIQGWNYLGMRGYQILHLNYRCFLGELDVVAQRDGRLAFVEIKTRRKDRFGTPEEAVHSEKQKRLVRLAAYYLKAEGWADAPVSFDVLAIRWFENREPEFHLIQDAFAVEATPP